MKFLRSLVLVTLIFCFAFTSLAAPIDYSTMSDTELIELEADLDTELSSRGINKTNLIMAGAYVAGIDIKPGAYVLTSVNREYYFKYAVYQDVDTYKTLLGYKSTIQDFYMPCTKIYVEEYVRINLEEGNVLYIDSGAAKVESQKADWAP